MKDENNQGNETRDMQNAVVMERLSARAGKLSERGAHYFVGWLIGAGMQKPAMMAEFEKVLTRLETDPKLRHCWRGNNEVVAEAPAGVAVAAVSIATSEENPAVATEVLPEAVEKPASVSEAPPAPVFEEYAHEHARSGMVKFETAAANAMPERKGFFAKIFRRQRMAA